MFSLRFLPFILSVIIFSCASNETQINPSVILKKAIAAHGGSSFNNSTISFNIAELQYQLYRKNNINEFEVTRNLDTVSYKAVYKNGYSAYFINDSLQEETFYSRKFIESKLEGLTYIFSIPHVLDQNATKLTLLEDVTIDNSAYYTLYATFTEIEGQPKDEFYLYINKDNFVVDYYAQKFNLTGGAMLFKKAINPRTINNIRFSDYWHFSIEANEDMKTAYQRYNDKTLKSLKKIEFENISVEINP